MHDLFDPADPSHSDAQRAGARGAQCSSDHLSTAVFGANTSAPTSDRVTHQATHWVARTALSVDHPRSEEHTSELQSLMRISYAVFCLKNKTNTQSQINT